MKKTSLLLFLVLVIFFNTSSLGASLKFPEDTSSKQQGLVLSPANINLYFLGKPMNISSKPYYANGRLYLPLNDVVSFLGATMTKSANNYNIFYNGKSLLLSAIVSDNAPVKPLIYSNNKPYISFYTLNKALGLVPVFDTLNNVVDIYYDGASPTINNSPLVKPSANAKKAYLRLEDITADGEDPNAVYTDDGLEKLRVIGSYLHYRNQEFYIAWIPIYYNPKAKIYNDISTRYNLYNASFIYTLDHLIDNGGHIGLHGLTHQYNNEITAIGYEFDENSPLNDAQMMSRMIQAK
ncbi:MAG: DUF2334 domain-containing protein, partial [Firmicutes bacterium]|nr:DUF2334 domain-containing protein [Bacillota bacterium]